MLSVIYDECRKQAHYAQCHYGKCCYTECRYAKGRCHVKLTKSDKHSSLPQYKMHRKKFQDK